MTAETVLSAAAPARQTFARTAIAATIGNVLEWFDFAVYVYFAATISMAIRRPPSCALAPDE
jgi:hypothetical protein